MRLKVVHHTSESHGCDRGAGSVVKLVEPMTGGLGDGKFPALPRNGAHVGSAHEVLSNKGLMKLNFFVVMPALKKIRLQSGGLIFLSLIFFLFLPFTL